MKEYKNIKFLVNALINLNIITFFPQLNENIQFSK